VGYWNNPPPVWRKPRAHQLQDLHLPPAIVALSQPFTARRFSCVLGMLSSLEVKVLCPT